jgi:hypothetical protein
MEKTCGNCHWYHEDSRGIGIGACLNMNSERMCSGNYFPCAHAKNYPCNHHASESSTLEQRFQQLAKVARDLYKAVEPMHESCNEDTCLNLIDEGWPSDACLYDFRKQLEELGVEL